MIPRAIKLFALFISLFNSCFRTFARICFGYISATSGAPIRNFLRHLNTSLLHFYSFIIFIIDLQ